MRRASGLAIATLFAFAFVLIAPAETHAAASREKNIFVEPSRGISFKLPGNGWKASAGFGREIASISGPGQAMMRVVWSDPIKSRAAQDAPSSAVMEQYPGSILKGIEQVKTAGRSETLVSFKTRDGLDGALIAVAAKNGVVGVFCADDDRAFVSTFLSCRQLASSISFDARSMDLASLNEAVRSVAARAEFALLDGRSGCPGIADEPRRMARIAAGEGDASSAQKLSRLADALEGGKIPRYPGGDGPAEIIKARGLAREGRVESARQILTALARKDDGLYAALELARISLDEGDSDGARRIISRVNSGRYGGASSSHLLAALRIRLARLDGDSATAAKEFESMQREICGSSGALAAHELGLAISRQQPARAAALFEQAIEADRSYAPAYLSLGHSMLDSGAGVGEVRARLKRLLALVPDSAELRSLRARFMDMEPSIERHSFDR
ncbi:MAG: hypothetical protein WC956_05020 [bacterium]